MLRIHEIEKFFLIFLVIIRKGIYQNSGIPLHWLDVSLF